MASATLPDNQVEIIATYVDPALGMLENQNCFIPTLNTKFEGFDEPKNLGETVNLELPNRATVNRGLVAKFTAVQQRKVPFVLDQAANSANAFPIQYFKWGYEEYMSKFGEARVAEISAEVEASIALNATSSVPVLELDEDGQSVPTGELHTESGPYRFYGDGFTPINSLTQLAKIEALVRNFGCAPGELKTYLPDMPVVDIIASAANQFVMDRNEKLLNSWDLGTYKGSNSRYYKSNLMPIHYAGTVGDNRDTLTVVSTNDPTGANITEITFSGVSTDAFAFRVNDLINFNITENGGLVYRTWIGHKLSQNPVQVRVLEDVDATGGTVTVKIFPALQSTPGLNQNLSKNLVAGMTAWVPMSHRAGLVSAGNAFYLAMPPLPPETPFPSSTATNPDTGVSLRHYWGSKFGANQKGYVNDVMWCSLAAPDYHYRLCFPLD